MERLEENWPPGSFQNMVPSPFFGGHLFIFSGMYCLENLRGKIGQNLATLDTPDHWLRLDMLDVELYSPDHHVHPQATSIHWRCARNEGITRSSCSFYWVSIPNDIIAKTYHVLNKPSKNACIDFYKVKEQTLE